MCHLIVQPVPIFFFSLIESHLHSVNCLKINITQIAPWKGLNSKYGNETKGKQRVWLQLLYLFETHHITKLNIWGDFFSILLNCLLECMVNIRSHKLKELIKLIQETNVDGVESWLKINIPSNFDVCFVNYITNHNHTQNTHTITSYKYPQLFQSQYIKKTIISILFSFCNEIYFYTENNFKWIR